MIFPLCRMEPVFSSVYFLFPPLQFGLLSFYFNGRPAYTDHAQAIAIIRTGTKRKYGAGPIISNRNATERSRC